MKQQRVEYLDNAIDWLFNDKFHRERDLPAAYHFIDRKLTSVSYCQNGKYHRIAGPARIYFKYKNKLYYYQDKKYSSLEEMLMLEACR